MKLKDSIKFGFGLYLGWTIARSINRGLGKAIQKSTVFNKHRESILESETNSEQNTAKRVVGFGPR